MGDKIVNNIVGQLKNQTLVNDVYFDEENGNRLTLSAATIAALTAAGSGDGWIPMAEAFTYVSSDAPSYVMSVPGDVTTKYYPGMRFKVTDVSIQYFILTKLSFGGGITTMTFYGGTDYSLSGGAITLPFFSMQKAPAGFPINPAKWTVSYSSAVPFAQATPTNNVWYPTGDLITLPIGLWGVRLKMTVTGRGTVNPNVINVIKGTLSTGNNDSESDSNLTGFGIWVFTSTIESYFGVTVATRSLISLTTKTAYYGKVLSSGGTSVAFIYATISGSPPTTIEAVSAYL